ncbi:DUF2732 family protein [Serratia marcescens]|uniref:DUF2732 family protein n=1 Tax=Serratia marcescens TaxID=615 RepID=UPI0013DB8A72|nr:DUF2732 family protein [Serratia marcescens]EIJ9189585.1 DUF2732 family protein [Serratia marcescens]MBS6088734.1 DUF2732 family protein [Serratia marcescens]HEJ6924998.1 DUF2732 family protein [Serratia marcescens]HEJ7006223.1 DUF2732 family protein [Serratia marcescens]HEJ7895123.1 DUF2732 family protein [Serratia marcescens]
MSDVVLFGIDLAKGDDISAVTVLLNNARIDERKNQADLAAVRLVRLAAHITKNGLTAIEAVELLHQEAEAIESQAQELH